MPRKKKEANGANGKPEDKLTENDRLSMYVAHERHGRVKAEVEALEAKGLMLQTLLAKAQQELAQVTDKLRAEFKRIQKTYKLEDDTPYNLDTGVISRKDNGEASAPK